VAGVRDGLEGLACVGSLRDRCRTHDLRPPRLKAINGRHRYIKHSTGLEARRGPGSGVRPVRPLPLANRGEGGAELGEPRGLAQHPIDAWRYRVLRQKMVPPASEENDQRPW
jgi:hypothetical protein